MGSEASEQMMALLNELAVLKAQNKECDSNPNEAEREEYRLRQQRHEEITEEIKALGGQKKTSEEASTL